MHIQTTTLALAACLLSVNAQSSQFYTREPIEARDVALLDLDNDDIYTELLIREAIAEAGGHGWGPQRGPMHRRDAEAEAEAEAGGHGWGPQRGPMRQKRDAEADAEAEAEAEARRFQRPMVKREAGRGPHRGPMHKRDAEAEARRFQRPMVKREAGRGPHRGPMHKREAEADAEAEAEARRPHGPMAKREARRGPGWRSKRDTLSMEDLEDLFLVRRAQDGIRMPKPRFGMVVHRRDDGGADEE